MLLSENLSPIFSSKSKTSTSPDTSGHGASANSHEPFEHDINILSNLVNLPAPSSFDALQVSNERYVIFFYFYQNKII